MSRSETSDSVSSSAQGEILFSMSEVQVFHVSAGVYSLQGSIERSRNFLTPGLTVINIMQFKNFATKLPAS